MVEVSTACNHRCVYCPVSTAPVRQKLMETSVFEHVLRLISLYVSQRGTRMERISLNHYNEPMLDPSIVLRIACAVQAEIFDYVLLNSNLSRLSPQTLEALLPFRGRIHWNVNIPTGIPARYAALHGKNDLDRVSGNVTRLIETGFTVSINVQSNSMTTADDLASVVTLFGKHDVAIETCDSRSRAGNIIDFDPVHHVGKIVGCKLDRPLHVLHVGVEGEIYLCCEDFLKQSAFTNIKHHEDFDSVLDSLRSAIEPIYGKRTAPADHLCRRCALASVSEEAAII